jgi:hypothetical protein
MGTEDASEVKKFSRPVVSRLRQEESVEPGRRPMSPNVSVQPRSTSVAGKTALPFPVHTIVKDLENSLAKACRNLA